MSNGGNRGDGEAVVGALIGIAAAVGLGLLGAAIINAITRSRCPSCGNLVERNAPYCQNCHTVLRWQ